MRVARQIVFRHNGDPIIATAILDRLLHHSTTINIRGESYQLKNRRRAGLVPPREQERSVAPPPWPRTQWSPAPSFGAFWAQRRPRPRRPIHELQGWGTFDRRNGEFSIGVDSLTTVVALCW
jgi:hypothetical protein